MSDTETFAGKVPWDEMHMASQGALAVYNPGHEFNTATFTDGFAAGYRAATEITQAPPLAANEKLYDECGEVLTTGIVCTRPIGHGGTHWARNLSTAPAEAAAHSQREPALEVFKSLSDKVEDGEVSIDELCQPERDERQRARAINLCKALALPENEQVIRDFENSCTLAEVAEWMAKFAEAARREERKRWTDATGKMRQICLEYLAALDKE